MAFAQPIRFSLSAFFAAATALALVVTTAAPASAASLRGTWSGSGTMKLSSGGTERVRCRVSYSGSGSHYSMTARCASGAGRITQSGSLSRTVGNKFQGTVYNAKYGVYATVYVTVRGRSQSVYISSAGGTGSFSLRKR